jgi:hypothetical protein
MQVTDIGYSVSWSCLACRVRDADRGWRRAGISRVNVAHPP